MIKLSPCLKKKTKQEKKNQQRNPKLEFYLFLHTMYMYTPTLCGYPVVSTRALTTNRVFSSSYVLKQAKQFRLIFGVVFFFLNLPGFRAKLSMRLFHAMKAIFFTTGEPLRNPSSSSCSRELMKLPLRCRV